MGRLLRLVCLNRLLELAVVMVRYVLTSTGIVGDPADELLGYEGVEGAVGPRFRTLSKEEIEDYLTNL